MDSTGARELPYMALGANAKARTRQKICLINWKVMVVAVCWYFMSCPMVRILRIILVKSMSQNT